MIFFYVIAIYAIGWILTLIGVIVYNKAKSYDDFVKPIVGYNDLSMPYNTKLINETVYMVFLWPFIWMAGIIIGLGHLVWFIMKSFGKGCYYIYSSALKSTFSLFEKVHPKQLSEEQNTSNKIILQESKDYRSPSIKLCPHCKKEIEQ